MGYRTAVAEEPLVIDESSAADTLPAAATSLRIAVLHDGRPVIQVSFPAYAIVNLADLVPHEVRPRVAAEALDLGELGARHAAAGCLPGELFSLQGASRHHIIRAWME